LKSISPLNLIPQFLNLLANKALPGGRIYVAAFKKETRMAPQEMRLYPNLLRTYIIYGGQ